MDQKCVDNFGSKKNSILKSTSIISVSVWFSRKHIIYLLNKNQTFSSKQTCWLCLLLIYNEEISNCLFRANGFNTFVGSNVTLFSLCATHCIRLLSGFFFCTFIYMQRTHGIATLCMVGYMFTQNACVNFIAAMKTF